MGFDKTYYVYTLASDKNGTLYTGVTNNLARRVYSHRTKVLKGFTQKYSISILVYYEVYGDINAAISREKQLKKWNRAWKLQLIEKHNPGWYDLLKDGEILALDDPNTLDSR